MIPLRNASRTALPRTARSVPRRQQLRLQSTTSAPASSRNSHIGAGVAGGLAGALLFYGAYSFTPAGRTASQVNKIAKDATVKYNEASKKLQNNTPTADEAVSYIKEFAYSYVGWIPGGRAYIDTAFDDWETVRKNHREDADKLVNDAYKQFQGLAKGGLTLATASKALDVLADLAKKVASLGGDAISDILDNHPQVKEKLGGNVDQLKQLGEQYGPEAKKQVDETWKQVKEIVAGGVSASNLDKARKLIEEKVEQVKKLGDEAWKQGLEQAKPLLEKNPKVKELLEKNADALKQGNPKELFEKAKSSIDSGDFGGLESYVNDAVKKVSDKAGSSGSGLWDSLSKYMQMIPQGDEILPKLKQIGEVADKHKEEGEKLLKETLEELKSVLEKKSEEGKKIAEKAKEDAK